MFCNTPGNRSDERRVQHIDLMDDELLSEGGEGDISKERDTMPVPGERSCSSGFCETDWKPRKETLS